ncbi:MAG: hypothetical protein LAT68_01640 [Cyclobacteriaceae bacterium]|nr:hypothetical protein [Cyclobacteriaceae bacterium]MCH8515005.1 hypothetical protein [Cyclobacteriaceae bacterium]
MGLVKKEGLHWLYSFLFISLLTISVLVLEGVLKVDWVHDQAYILIGLFSVLLIASALIAESGLKNGKNFGLLYLITVVSRFFICFIYVFIVVWIGDPNILLFVFNFFALYFLFLLFEIYNLIANLRPNFE